MYLQEEKGDKQARAPFKNGELLLIKSVVSVSVYCILNVLGNVYHFCQPKKHTHSHTHTQLRQKK